MWSSADQAIIQQAPDKGWEIKDNGYEIVWFEGPQLPEKLQIEDDSQDE